ncbi:MAG TPA: hypothetical protein VF064_18855 [Pyrinomonadaceae bacterium]
MRRTFAAAAAAVLFALALVLPSPHAVRTVRADPPDPCTKCLGKVQHEYEKCQARFGPVLMCDEEFNQGIVNCFATVCEL